MKIMLILPLFLILLGSTSNAQEKVSAIVFDYYSKAKPYALKAAIDQLSLFENRSVSGIEVYAAPQRKESWSEFKIGLVIHGLRHEKSLPYYDLDSIHDVRPLEFEFPTITLNELLAGQIVFDQDIALVKIRIQFTGLPKCNFDGSDCGARVKELSKSLQKNLYEENNFQPIDVYTRISAADDLAQYPAQTAFDALFKVYQYNGKWIDYDLRSQAKKSMKVLCKNIRAFFGEETLVLYFEDVIERATEPWEWMIVVDLLAEFETSAPLFFVIKIHTYSKTDNGNSNSQILEKIKQLPDFSYYVSRYKNRILKEIFYDKQKISDATELWAKSRACQVFAFAPQPGLLQSLLPVTNDSDFANSADCGDAVVAALQNLDLKTEAAPFEDEMTKVITEVPARIPSMPRFEPVFSYSLRYRKIAILALNQIHQESCRQTLISALKIAEIDPSERILIEGILKAWSR